MSHPHDDIRMPLSLAKTLVENHGGSTSVSESRLWIDRHGERLGSASIEDDAVNYRALTKLIFKAGGGVLDAAINNAVTGMALQAAGAHVIEAENASLRPYVAAFQREEERADRLGCEVDKLKERIATLEAQLAEARKAIMEASASLKYSKIAGEESVIVVQTILSAAITPKPTGDRS